MCHENGWKAAYLLPYLASCFKRVSMNKIQASRTQKLKNMDILKIKSVARKINESYLKKEIKEIF